MGSYIAGNVFDDLVKRGKLEGVNHSIIRNVCQRHIAMNWLKVFYVRNICVTISQST